jgi:regulator of replication initiation timing
MSLVTVFVAKNNGKRAAENRRRRKREAEQEEEEEPKRKKSQANKPPTGKAILYRLYPTSDQKQLLQQWFGVARWTYDKCLDAIKNLNKKSTLP